MKTREEIEQEFNEGCRAVWAAHEPQLNAISAAEAAELDALAEKRKAALDALAEKRKAALDALAEKRKAALAELDDPMLRLIAAARRAVDRHAAPGACRCEQCRELRDAIDYTEQRRAQG
jgi:hypothetical protein